MWFGFACRRRRFSAVIIMYEYDDAVVPSVTLLSFENGTFLDPLSGRSLLGNNNGTGWVTDMIYALNEVHTKTIFIM